MKTLMTLSLSSLLLAGSAFAAQTPAAAGTTTPATAKVKKHRHSKVKKTAPVTSAVPTEVKK